MSGEETVENLTSAKTSVVGVTGDIGVAREDCGAIVRLSVKHNIGLIVPDTGEEVCPFFTRIIGKTEIGVAIAGVELEPAEFVNEKEVNNPIDRVGAVNGGGAGLRGVNVRNE